MNLLENVAASAELAQGLLPALGEFPRHGRQALGESEPFKLLEASDER